MTIYYICICLDEFMKAFEARLRSTIATGCDFLAELRMVFFRSMFVNSSLENIVASTRGVFEQRLHLIISQETDQRSNYCDVLFMSRYWKLLFSSFQILLC